MVMKAVSDGGISRRAAHRVVIHQALVVDVRLVHGLSPIVPPERGFSSMGRHAHDIICHQTLICQCLEYAGFNHGLVSLAPQRHNMITFVCGST